VSLEGFSREYHRNDSLESFSGVCLWRDFLGNSRGVTLWRVFSGLFLWRDFLRYCGVSLEGFSREYQRGDSLESFSGVFLWRDVLRYHTACVTGRCISGIPEITIVGPHFFDAAVKKTRNKSGQRSSLPAAHRDVNKPDC
jgi:hypothetical protein